jgi:hypothetical protein
MGIAQEAGNKFPPARHVRLNVIPSRSFRPPAMAFAAVSNHIPLFGASDGPDPLSVFVGQISPQALRTTVNRTFRRQGRLRGLAATASSTTGTPVALETGLGLSPSVNAFRPRACAFSMSLPTSMPLPFPAGFSLPLPDRPVPDGSGRRSSLLTIKRYPPDHPVPSAKC